MNLSYCLNTYIRLDSDTLYVVVLFNPDTTYIKCIKRIYIWIYSNRIIPRFVRRQEKREQFGLKSEKRQNNHM